MKKNFFWGKLCVPCKEYANIFSILLISGKLEVFPTENPLRFRTKCKPERHNVIKAEAGWRMGKGGLNPTKVDSDDNVTPEYYVLQMKQSN